MAAAIKARWQQLRWLDVAVPVVFTFYFVMRAVDRIFNTRIAQILSNPVYLTIYSNVVFPVGLMLMQMLLSVFYVLLMRYWYKNREYGLGFFSPRSKLASTNGAYPQYLLCLFIVGDVISNLLSTWGSATLDQTVQNLLMQLSLLFIVLFSMIFLGTRYKMVHYIACVLVVMSTLVAITTQVMFEGETLGSLGCATANPLYDLTTPLVAPIGSYELSKNPTVYAPSGILYFALFALSTVPLAASNVFKQWCLADVGKKHGELDVMYASLFSSYWQTLFSLALIPIIWVPFPNVEQVLPSQTGQAIADTFTCFFGGAPAGATPEQQALCTQESGSAALWFLVYSIFNMCFNISLCWLTKYLSSTWTQVAGVMVLVLSSLLSMSPALQGSRARPITYEEGMGMVIGVIALWAYSVEDERSKDGSNMYLIERKKEEDKAANNVRTVDVEDGPHEDEDNKAAHEVHASSSTLRFLNKA